MEKKKQPNFSFDELEASTSSAITYCCTRVMWWCQLHILFVYKQQIWYFIFICEIM